MEELEEKALLPAAPDIVFAPSVSATEAFIVAVEAKTTDEIHARLLKASRSRNPASSLESELQAIINEIIYAD